MKLKNIDQSVKSKKQYSNPIIDLLLTEEPSTKVKAEEKATKKEIEKQEKEKKVKEEAKQNGGFEQTSIFDFL